MNTLSFPLLGDFAVTINPISVPAVYGTLTMLDQKIFQMME